ncbi:hypothetical protein [Roseococcus sp. YIM B11640]|uniref:hypothetical protein n=1 Tax=Roseococcus sp. YIM B11640 TaxID=3133973 RepID=UPI003C7E3C4E
MDSRLLLLVGLVVVPALVIWAVPTRWLGRTTVLWLISPLFAYYGWIFWEAATQPMPAGWLGASLYPLAYMGAFLLLPWLGIWLAGIVLGFTLRHFLRRAPPPPPPPVPAAAVPAAPLQSARETGGWRFLHIGFERDGLRIGGVDVWSVPWHEAGPPVELPHPTHPGQMHSHQVLEAGEGTGRVRFAVGELSNGVWGFWLPTDLPVISQGVSADGSLRFAHRLGEYMNGRDHSFSSWAVVTEAATGCVRADAARWGTSWAENRPDGSLFLRAELNGFDALFRIDPARRVFRDQGAGGPERPLEELDMALEEARQGAAGSGFRRLISPDGELRVDLQEVEWGNSHWVRAPRVVETATGQVLVDFWNTDWDASPIFPGPGKLRLGLRRYHEGGAIAAEIDLKRRLFRIEGEGRLRPLNELADAMTVAARRSRAAAPPPPPVRRHPFAAWRAALLILVGALVAIAGGTYATMRFGPKPPAQPLPTVPSFKPPSINR